MQLEKELAEKVENLRRDYLDRELAALNDTSTLAGKLAEYERKAAREREDAVKAGGMALVELDRAQAAERGRILRDAAKEIEDYYGGLRQSITDFTRGLQFGNLSTLSPAEQSCSRATISSASLSLRRAATARRRAVSPMSRRR